MDFMAIVTHIEQLTVTEVHELKAWLDLHVLHRAAQAAETPAEPAEPVVAAPSGPVAEPAAETTARTEPGEHTDGA